MTPGKQKSRDDKCHTCLESLQPAEVELNGIITVHRYNVSIVAEWMAASVNSCIQAPFAMGCSIQMSCSNGSPQGFDCANSMQSPPEIDNALSYWSWGKMIDGLMFLSS